MGYKTRLEQSSKREDIIWFLNINFPKLNILRQYNLNGIPIKFIWGTEYNDFNVHMKEYYLRVIFKYLENNNKAYSKTDIEKSLVRQFQ